VIEMDKEFLVDYEAKEKKEIKNFGRKFTQGYIKYEDRYPSSNRLKLKEPYCKSIVGEKIWNQIPLYGTTIIVLQPTRKEIFEKVHGFNIEDLERLVDFAKETGRLQFALAEYPINYLKMDFLETVFRELKPPKLIHIPLDWIVSKKEIEKFYDEMQYLLENQKTFDYIMEYIKNKYPESVVSQDYIKRGIIDDLMRLKLLGYKNLVDVLRELIEIDAKEMIFLLAAIHDIFLSKYDPLKGIKTFKTIDRNKLPKKLFFEPKIKIEAPYEVGKFLNKKLKLIVPKNFDGAIEISDKYNLYDLRNVMNALNTAVERQKNDEIEKKSTEISQVFENVWNDAYKLKKKVNVTKYGISIGFAVVGAVATLPFAGAGGLLGGLGFIAADKCLEVKTYESISERIVKFGSQSHIMHIYDFNKKYKLF
jgi:hypothetical protein